MEKELQNIVEIAKTIPAVRLAYLFGSRARRDAGDLSDYDFAFYLDEHVSKKQMFEIKLELQEKISRALKSDHIDVTILNLTDSPELKYFVIKDGQLLYEQEPYRVIVEPRIYDEYFDFRESLRRYHLTQV